MRKLGLIVLLVSLFVFLTSCANQEQPKPAASNEAQPEYRVTATIKDIMDSEVDPSADFIWESVQTIVSAKGTENRMPRTDEEWKEVRRKAITLIEATNLLQIPGRHVAKPGEKADDPKVELGPEQIEELINKDRASWIKKAHGLHDAAMQTLAAIDAKDAEKLLDVGNAIDEACEQCHLQYWYPNERKPPAEQTSEKK